MDAPWDQEPAAVQGKAAVAAIGGSGCQVCLGLGVSQRRPAFQPSAGWEAGDTAGLETCATGLSRFGQFMEQRFNPSSITISYAQPKNLVFHPASQGVALWSVKTIRRANERGHAEHGWLDSYHTFSFADYYDPNWMGFRALRVINDDLVMPGQGFGTHPHRDMEIITYVLSGALEHKDSMGNGRIIRPGETQYMAAGTGIQHSEFNPSKDEAVHLLQIWIVPDRKGVKPRYGEKSMANAPTGRFNLVASKSGREDSLAIHQDADFYIARLEPGQKASHQLRSGRHAWLHVAEGQVKLDGDTLQSGDAVAFSSEPGVDLVAVKPSQVLLFDLN